MAKAEVAGVRAWVPKGIVAVVPSVDERAPEPMVEVAEMAQTASLPVAEVAASEIDPAVIDKARAEGYALGLAEGKRQREQHAAAECDSMQALMRAFEKMRQDLQASLADEVLSLALEMAKVMIRQALEFNPHAVLPALREATLALPGLGQQTVLHLHPQDAALVRPLLTQDPTLAQTAWTVVEDTRVERGGCRLETAQSEVDATLATRWSRVVAALGREDGWRTESKTN